MDSQGFFAKQPKRRESVSEQLKRVRGQISETEHLALVYKGKMDALDALNATIAEGYANNLHIIVDISKLLSEYRQMMTKVVDKLNGIYGNTAKVDGIQELTSNKLENVTQFFENDVKEMKGLLAMFGKDELAGRLGESEANFLKLRGMK